MGIHISQLPKSRASRYTQAGGAGDTGPSPGRAAGSPRLWSRLCLQETSASIVVLNVYFDVC